MTDAFNTLLTHMRGLPLVLTVGTGPERFHVVHAELMRPHQRTRWQTVWLDSDIDDWVAGKSVDDVTRERMLWGRGLWSTERSAGAPMREGLSTTFCGHTVGATVRHSLSHVCLDTGAYRSLKWGCEDAASFGLTLYSVRESRHLRAFHGCREVVAGR